MSSKAGIAFVIGSPINHSLSPAIFSFIAQQEKSDLSYSRKEVKVDELQTFLKEQRLVESLVGFNVTIPHKESMLTAVDDLSDEAKSTGAVNVIKKVSHELHGYNTDVIGIHTTLTSMNFSIQGKVCLIWGAGGAAKALAYILGKEKAKIVYIFNRSDKGQTLAQTFNKLYNTTQFTPVSSLDEITESIDLMCNTTPLGMTGKESGLNYFDQAQSLNFNPQALAFDLIYTPRNTDFLKVSRSLGLKTVGGLGMLIDQAIASWKIWLGNLQDEENLHQKLDHLLSGILILKENTKPVFLTGFMGVGKSAIGVRLANLTGRTFLDTDDLIVKKAGKSIAEIFEAHGEAHFRQLESEAIKEASVLPMTVISLGGGAIQNEDNLNHIRSAGKLIYLSAESKTLGVRVTLGGASRPLLKGLNETEMLAKIKDLLNARLPAYQKAHHQVDTDNKNEDEVVFSLLSMLGGLK